MNNNFGAVQGCPTNTLCAPLAWPSTSGNTIVVEFEYTSALTITSVTSDQGDTFTLASASSAVSSKIVAAYYKTNATASTHYIKILASGTGKVFHTFVSEMAGIGSLRNSVANTNGSTSTTLNSGSLTPTSGDLLISFECRAGTPGAGNNFTAGTGQAGATWVLWLVDNQDGCADEWSTWSGSGAINPVMTSASSSTAAGVTLDFAPDTTNGANPSGLYLAKAMEGNTTLTASAGKTVNYQFPTIGNLEAILGGCGAYVIDPATPPSGTNTWKTLNVFSSSNTSVGAAAAQNASADATGALAVKWITGQGFGTGDCDFLLYDVAGAKTSNALANRLEIQGNQSTNSSSIAYTTTYAPATSAGIVLSQDSHVANTSTAITAPSNGQFMAGTYGGETLDVASTPGQNNFRATAPFSSNAAQSWTGSLSSATDPAGAWVIDFVAVNDPAATLGPYASPLYTGTCSPNCTVTSAAIKTTNTISAPVASGVYTAMVGWDGGGTMSCADGTNGTYTAVDSPVTATFNATSMKFQTFWVANTTTSAITITCTETGGTPTAGKSWLAALWLNGVTTLDQHPAIRSFTPTGSNPCQSNTTSTTSAANEVVTSFYIVGNSAGNSGTNITNMLQDSARTNGYAAGAYSVASTGTYNAQWFEDTAGSACAVSVNTFQ